VRSVLGELADGLTRSGRRDVEVMAKDSVISRWDREGNFGESGIEGFDIDWFVALLSQSENGEEAFDL